jgi:DHA2 family multidrug resistance protein
MVFSDPFFLLGTALVIATVPSLMLRKAGHISAGGAHCRSTAKEFFDDPQ